MSDVLQDAKEWLSVQRQPISTLSPEFERAPTVDIVARLVKEIHRLKSVIDTYALVCESSAKEIKALRER